MDCRCYTFSFPISYSERVWCYAKIDSGDIVDYFDLEDLIAGYLNGFASALVRETRRVSASTGIFGMWNAGKRAVCDVIVA